MGILCRMFLIASVLVMGTVASQAGNDPNEQAIKARRALMQLHSWYGGTLFAMAKGDIDYDAETAARAAINLQMIVGADGANMWPADSHSQNYPGQTRALAKAWSDYNPEYHANMVAAADAMAGAAGGGLDMLRSKIKAIGQGCSGCHDAYRAEDF